MVSLLPRAPCLASLSKPAPSLLRQPPPAMSSSFVAAPASAWADATGRPRKLPVLLFDVMDTLVRDPFYHHIPAFFQFRTPLSPPGLYGLKECMVRAYEYIDGVEDILSCLKKNNYEMHAFTNYPVWWARKRKPSPDFYLQAVDHLNVEPASCIFIDDRMVNIEAALSVGMVGLQFKNAEALRKDLCALGVELSPVCEGEAQVQ
ncbi:hypothetical protein HU200_008721 [Digitaria exilis]|uniref:Uncharacterized protein n=1 Tax=Digitaria exilis TaxID=1010633 RepID=A0A835KQ42_9POAL|nr:hypothetical protein HU200_008721 [Digitaria exilis]